MSDFVCICELVCAGFQECLRKSYLWVSVKRRAQVSSEIQVRRVQARCRVKGNVCFKENVVSEKKDSLTNPTQ